MTTTTPPRKSPALAMLGLVGTVLFLAGCSQVHPEPELLVVNALNEQADAWQRGNLDTFLQHYWASDELTLFADGRAEEGSRAARTLYEPKVPAGNAAGRLVYDLIRVQPLAPDVILVTGRWQVDRGTDSQAGRFSRVFRRIDGRWVIAHEHLSTGSHQS